MAGYISVQNLKDAIGITAYLAIFDDTNLGPGSVDTIDASGAVALVLSRAHAEVTSYLRDEWLTLVPGLDQTMIIPQLLVSAELDYAVAFAFERHPEYVRTFGDQKRVADFRARAEKTMTNLVTAFQRLVDNPTPLPQGNVGGVVFATGPRMMVDDPIGNPGVSNGGDF